MALIDTHCHLNFDSYDEDREAVLARAAVAEVTRIINPSVDLESSHAALALAAAHPKVIYAAVGVHPNSTSDFDADMLTQIQAMVEESQAAANGQIVAIGEIGLDYYWDKSPKPQQLAAFEAQLALAADLALPVIIHNREASEDVIAVLENWVKTLPPSLKDRAGVLHSFSASQAIADRALAAGFYLGFGGTITYKNAEDLRRIAAQVPLDRMLVETDAPFLTPVPYRGKRNSPEYIPLIVERLAALKTTTPAAIAEATTANADTLFRLVR